MNKKETMFKISAHQLLHMLECQVAAIGTVYRSTYNQQDPTERIKMKCWVLFQMDPYLLKDYKYTPTEEDLKECPPGHFEHMPPPAAVYQLILDNITWGTEVTLEFKDSAITHEELMRHRNPKNEEVIESIQPSIAFYLDHQTATWYCGISRMISIK